ncbi:MAG: hypothetical protein KDC98_04900 [Planctomycetes bacterium]|nr:hypothetical protein [Planctomycetota bacterium]
MRTACLLLPLFLAAIVPAQFDLLAVEREADLAGHARTVKLLRQAKAPLAAKDMTAKELCAALTAATNDAVRFVCSRRDSEAAPRLDLSARNTNLLTILAAAEQQTGLRAIYRRGAVFLTKPEDYAGLLMLRVYDLRAATMPLRDFPGPDLRLRTPGDDRPLFPEEVESGNTVCGVTADGLESLLTTMVHPDSWAKEGRSFNNQNGLFFIRQTPEVHAEIERLLIQVGAISPPPVLRRR